MEKKLTRDMRDRVILGIDPGTNIMGYGVVKGDKKGPLLLDLGIIDLHKIKDPYKKLEAIFNETIILIDKYNPTDLAIEAPFYGRNIQSMLKLGRAQGTAISAAIFKSVDIFEYAPRKIKMSITGTGSASKEQVAVMLGKMLDFPMITKNLDATDGLAAAVCHYYQDNSRKIIPQYKNWKSFLKNNPDRIC